MALRKELRERKRMAEEQETWILAYWSEEESISAHKAADVVDCTMEIGACCTVAFGRKNYVGKVAATGFKSDMLKLVDDFYEGVFTPFFEVKYNDGESNDGNANDQFVSATNQNKDDQSVSTINRNKDDQSISTINQNKDDQSVSTINQNKDDQSVSTINQNKDDQSVGTINQNKDDQSVGTINQNKDDQSVSASNQNESTEEKSTVEDKPKKKRKRKLVNVKEDTKTPPRNEKRKKHQTVSKNKENKDPKKSHKQTSKSTVKGKKKGSGILTTGSGKCDSSGSEIYISDQANDGELEGWSDYNPAEDIIDDMRYEDEDGEYTGKQPKDTVNVNKKEDDHKTGCDANDTLALKARVLELEAKHVGVKNQMFEMECKLLKCISDNKLYVVRKMKELSQAIKLNVTGNGTGVSQAFGGMSQSSSVPIVTGNGSGVSQACFGMSYCTGMSQASNTPIAYVSSPLLTSASSFEDSYCEDEETGSNSSSETSYNWQYPASSCAIHNRRHTTRTPQRLLPPMM